MEFKREGKVLFQKVIEIHIVNKLKQFMFESKSPDYYNRVMFVLSMAFFCFLIPTYFIVEG